MVDVVPWQPTGNFSGVLVENNTIQGGFATEVCLSTHHNTVADEKQPGTDMLGKNNASAIIKIGIVSLARRLHVKLTQSGDRPPGLVLRVSLRASYPASQELTIISVVDMERTRLAAPLSKTTNSQVHSHLPWCVYL